VIGKLMRSRTSIVVSWRLCLLLHIPQVVGRIVLEVELLLPLVRIALACLTVDSLQLLQAQAVGEQHRLP
jgi:hypothetical protein